MLCLPHVGTRLWNWPPLSIRGMNLKPALQTETAWGMIPIKYFGRGVLGNEPYDPATPAVAARGLTYLYLCVSPSSTEKNSGYETAAASAPLIFVSPSARSAATAKAMAMRWSPNESISAP